MDYRGLVTNRNVKSWRDRWQEGGGWASIPRQYSAVKKGDKAEFYIYEQIGLDYWDGSGVTAKQFIDDLKAAGDVSAIDLHINSPGGVVSEADAIYTALVQSKAKVNVFIDGLAASAASYIPMAGDTITIAEHAKFMIHNAWGVTIGNAREMRQHADVLDKLDSSIRLIYQRRTGKPDQQIKDWMEAETWFSGAEAKDAGFADAVTKAKGPTGDAKDSDIIDLMRMRLALAKTS